MRRLRYENGPLDRTDEQLLLALSENGRASIADLARRVGLSSPSVSERLKRLEEAGIVTGYAARIDAAALGCRIGAWLRIRPIAGKLKETAAILEAAPEIVSCDRITGDDCFLAKAQVPDIADLEPLIDKINQVASTNTSIIQSTIVAPRLPSF
ncbi:Lrp/AsnC family transcriptional regulator [Nisaea acidiphila]|uniref:Lrp/AsnC family transcriptional regulator n=1 Tax=Nisaea acidiphila TaxID=1862145 RepID=A0A9J7ATH0_9PROT|nr:Lrp/AsnC family transcriptional regulator [Nisaea acidiphila]UUX50632.1 Lrp/AsnC family transcriptional regulator [Nisaea acidiphila]